ncbi:4-hydroxyphenylacetate 3-hydroxylase family protein [Burkholderia sp. BCC1993]|uniref:4-hydroxyphenylacetate 3-hydroxylase family protein n=1 Tax=Burkholderia sp. BCC1993 TaxID=2817444 RepID=UPI002AB31C14|nr:4-hydroxyphenylacetate 3-hydroxylase N-terminal domain-containing protein [Burkholderia sp. BCC1993]
MSKTGNDYIESLRDGRSVYINGERVDDHVDHPAFRNAVRTVASLYDFQAANQELMTFTSPGNGRQVNRAWQLPKTAEDLAARAAAHVAWARQTGGWLGRSPDHVPSALVGMLVASEVFEQYDPARAAALRSYYEWARDNDIALTYTIVNPQGDRSKDVGDQGVKYHSLGVVDEDAEGITVRGAKMLGTAAVLAQECLVGVQNPLKPDDEIYALSFAIPLAAKGVKILSRRSYEQAASSTFDYPLATQFDENDALIYFDDVKVPWDRVFVYRRPDMCGAMFHKTAAEAMMNLQSQARFTVKLQFLLGIARRLTETTGTINFPPIQDVLGKLAAQAMAVEGNFQSLYADPVTRNGFFVPKAARVYSATSMGQELYPHFVNEIRGLAGGGVIMLPSSAEDFANPEMAALIEQTQRSAAIDPQGRVKLMKLAWDALGSEFGSRHTQYEMFYSGPPFVQHMRCFGHFDWGSSTDMVDGVMAGYGLPNGV